MSKLWYDKWAYNWNEALPIGNGRIGGMVFADPSCDKIVLNEETLWSGSPETDDKPHSMETMRKARALIKSKRFTEAEKLIRDSMEGRRVQMYLTLGSLNAAFSNFDHRAITEYRRELDLDAAVITAVCKQKSGDEMRAEYFTSLADDVMAVSYRSNRKEALSLTVGFDFFLDVKVTVKGDTLTAEGRCPTGFDPNARENSFFNDPDKESVPFCIILKVITDGEITGAGRYITISRASDVKLIYSIATGFNGFDKQPISEGKNYVRLCNEKMEQALQLDFEALKARHTARYSEQNSRMKLELDGDDFEYLPTDKRIENAANGVVDNKLTNLLFDYGKYLMISCSQPGGQPANLQGIWTKDVISPWHCNYTVNINTEMNYWPVEQMNLPECHMPLMSMLRDLSRRDNHYGLKGWKCAHNTDLWRFNIEATRDVLWGFWNMGGAWMARHIYEHYCYTRDVEFLKEHIDILEGVYDFFEGWTFRDEDGRITTSPSTSPENQFLYDGNKIAATEGSAMDLSIIKDFLTYMIELEGTLGNPTEKYERMLRDLKPVGIGSDGRILEFGEEYEEVELGHRHISHLYGVYPANTIRDGTPLFEAAKKSLETRLANGGGHTGWSNAWIACVYARFKDGEAANRHIINMFKKSIYPNLFDAHPPFQIDGNFGICAAILEMLVQVPDEKPQFLPALPEAWQSGRVTGMKLHNGKCVDFAWRQGKLTELSYR